MKLLKRIDKRTAAILFVGIIMGVLIVWISAAAVHHTSTVEFCTSCHEMRFLAEQGWQRSIHHDNPSGVVAGCSDCHVPPELFPMLWVKTRDGMKDVFVHFFGNSDPQTMDWDELGRTARGNIRDSACQRCHINLTPKGADIKTLVAHRANLRREQPKRCLECHKEEFHGGFRHMLDGQHESGHGAATAAETAEEGK